MMSDDLDVVDDGVLSRSLLQLLDGLDRGELSARDVQGRLGEALGAAERVLGVDRVGLMLLDENDDLQVVGSSDEASERLESAQQRLRIGPTWDSLHGGQAIAVADLAATGDGQASYAALWRWLQQHAEVDGGGTGPEDAPPAVPVRAVLSVAVRSRGEVVGTLNAMRARSGPWSEQQIRAVQAYADVVGTLLALSAAVPPPRAAWPDPGHDG
jgi:GAF domain-containing protein